MRWFSKADGRDSLTDEQAIDRYRYMLRTAPPDAIEQAHAEAFAQLNPSQRRQVFEQLSRATPPEDRQYLHDDPNSLARLATRSEIRQPGILERLFGSVRGGPSYGGGFGMGSMLAGSLLGSVAGTFIGSAIANSFFEEHPFDGAESFASGDIHQDAGVSGHDLGEELSPDMGDYDSGGFDDSF